MTDIIGKFFIIPVAKYPERLIPAAYFTVAVPAIIIRHSDIWIGQAEIKRAITAGNWSIGCHSTDKQPRFVTPYFGLSGLINDDLLPGVIDHIHGRTCLGGKKNWSKTKKSCRYTLHYGFHWPYNFWVNDCFQARKVFTFLIT